MPTIEEKITTKLNAATAITDLCAGRIYPNIKAQNTELPAMLFSQISEINYPAMGVDSGVIKSRFQFNCYGNDYNEAKTLANLVKTEFNRWRDNDAPKVYDCFLTNTVDLYDEDQKQQLVAVDFEIQYYIA